MVGGGGGVSSFRGVCTRGKIDNFRGYSCGGRGGGNEGEVGRRGGAWGLSV
jgi:hypothetical protein